MPGYAPSCAAPAAAATERASLLSFADIELDEDTHEVRKDGEEVSLSPTEFKLLRYFMQNPGRVLSKAQILDHVWHYDFGGDAGIVESYVSYLRRRSTPPSRACCTRCAEWATSCACRDG